MSRRSIHWSRRNEMRREYYKTINVNMITFPHQEKEDDPIIAEVPANSVIFLVERQINWAIFALKNNEKAKFKIPFPNTLITRIYMS